MKIICLIGLSASGKDTILQRVSYDLNIDTIISHTTRPMRENELDGLNYHFVSDNFFEDNKNKFIEQRLYKVKKPNGKSEIWRYGIHEDSINKGYNITIVDPEGYYSLAKYFGKDNVIPFYIFASDETRLKRLKQRGDTSNIEEVKRRFIDDNRRFKEFINSHEYYKICNEHSLDDAVEEIECIIENIIKTT